MTPPPRWAVLAAHAVSLVVLPSALWRLPLIFGFSMGGMEDGQPVSAREWEAVYILGLSVVTELAALATLGLVRPWGRRFPPRLVVAVASFGVVSLAFIWGFAFRNFPDVGLEFSHGFWHVLLVVCYTPLLLWAPLLAAVTYDYYRRAVRGRMRPAGL
jgi:hypothetical protein